MKKRLFDPYFGHKMLKIDQTPEKTHTNHTYSENSAYPQPKKSGLGTNKIQPKE